MNDKATIKSHIEEFTKTISIEQIERFLGYYDLKGTGIELRDYQRVAVEKTDSILQQKRFASVVLPTGGGKTYVALTQLLSFGKTKEEQETEQKAIQQKEVPYIQNQRKMLYLAPSNEILEQTKNKIIENIHGMSGTLGKSKDEIIKEVFPNIKFATYSSLLARSGKSVIEGKYDFVVLDELHRTGAEKWEKKLDKLLENQSEDTRILGITATPTRDVDDRNMADEMALKLGYTEEEIEAQSHIAINLDLIEAIKLGLVVNPKLVSCEYMLNNDGSMENLLESINSISDEGTRKEKLEQYEKLRRNLENAKGIPEILQANIKQGGKYIVFIPVTDQGEIEDEDGNKIGKKTGQDKIKEYEAQLQKYLDGSGIGSEYYSMLGSYSDKKNLEQLEQFENDKSGQTKFMLVMNKANEGLHVNGVTGIVWLRALDENSKILYLQQLGRAIYSEDPNNLTKDEDRPVVIDLSNNTAKVDINKEIKETNRKDDLQLLSIVVDWVNLHQMFPSIESTSNQERRYAATLYRIQNKYMKYANGVEQAEELEEETEAQIERIIELGTEIDLWNTELPPATKVKIDSILNIQEFELTGILKGFYELERDTEEILGMTAVERFIETLRKLQLLGIDGSMIRDGDTIQTLCARNGISEEAIKNVGLKLEDKIEQHRDNILQVYRGYARGVMPTESQIEIMREFGVKLEREKRTVEEMYSEFIEQLQKLNELGIDGSMIKSGDTIKVLCTRNKIVEEEIKKVGVDLEYNIGYDRNRIQKLYRGAKKGIMPTEQQVAIMRELGVKLERTRKRRRTAEEMYSEFIEQLQKLYELGIDGSMIRGGDTIQTLCAKNEIGEGEIKKLGLNLEYDIGQDKERIQKRYRDDKKEVIPTEQVTIMRELGVELERKLRTAEEMYSEFIEQLQKLNELGIDGSKIENLDTIQTLCARNGIGEKEIKDVGLNLEYKVGQDKSAIQRVYRGKRNGVIPTEQEAIMRKLGVKLEKTKRKKRTSEELYSEFIEQLQKLKQLGLDGSMIKTGDTIKTLCARNGIGEEDIKNVGLNLEDKIGQDRDVILMIYRGSRKGVRPTETQVATMRESGVALERKDKRRTGQELGQATFDAPVEQCDQAQVFLDKLVQKEQEKGGITQNE